MTRKLIPPSPTVAALEPYQSARMTQAFDPSKIYLDANEAPSAPPPADIAFETLNRYADAETTAIAAAYADYAGVAPDNVLATRGIDEGIELLIRAYCEPHQDEILIMPPTYGMYQAAAAAHRCAVARAPLRPNGGLDLAAIEALPNLPKILFVCRPNNPTGGLCSTADLEALLSLAGGRSLVALDEAYIEFCIEETWAGRIQDFPHLVVMRTLSKAFGLAGIHVGYCLAAREVIATLRKLINPYPIPSPCADIARAALSAQGRIRLKETVAYITDAREDFAAFLKGLPDCRSVAPSKTNFLLAEFDAPDAVFTRLTASGIHPRRFAAAGQMARIRFTIGDKKEMERTKEALGAG